MQWKTEKHTNCSRPRKKTIATITEGTNFMSKTSTVSCSHILLLFLFHFSTWLCVVKCHKRQCEKQILCWLHCLEYKYCHSLPENRWYQGTREKASRQLQSLKTVPSEEPTDAGSYQPKFGLHERRATENNEGTNELDEKWTVVRNRKTWLKQMKNISISDQPEITKRLQGGWQNNHHIKPRPTETGQWPDENARKWLENQ